MIRMLQEIMGSDSFFAGIAKYLVKYEWGTAKTDDLWAELGQVNELLYCVISCLFCSAYLCHVLYYI